MSRQYGVFWPLQGLFQVSGAPAGTEMDKYFEHQSNTPFGQVLDGSNTSSGQSNSHPYARCMPCLLPNGGRE